MGDLIYDMAFMTIHADCFVKVLNYDIAFMTIHSDCFVNVLNYDIAFMTIHADCFVKVLNYGYSLVIMTCKIHLRLLCKQIKPSRLTRSNRSQGPE